VCGKPRIQEGPIRIDFRSVQHVVVTPEDQDRFVTTSREAAMACRRAEDEKAWDEQFHRFLAHVHEWSGKHSDLVSGSYVGVSDEGLRVFLTTRGDGYRFDFDDEVSDLDLELDRLFPNCPCTVMHLPESPKEALTSFFSLADAIQTYGR